MKQNPNFILYGMDNVQIRFMVSHNKVVLYSGPEEPDTIFSSIIIMVALLSCKIIELFQLENAW